MAVLTTFLLVAVSVAVLIRLTIGYLKFRRMELAIPGPPSLPLLGNVLSFLTASRNDVLQRLLQYWDPHRHRGLYRITLFNKLIVLVSDPMVLDEVSLSKNLNDKSYIFYDHLRDVLGDGLVVLNGEKWKIHRRALQPAFHKEILEQYIPVFQHGAREYVSRIVVDVEQDVVPSLITMNLSIFLRNALSEEGWLDLKHLQPVLETMIEMGPRVVNQRTFQPLFWSNFIYGLTANGRKARHHSEGTKSFIRMLIQSRKQELIREAANNFKETKRTIVDTILHSNFPEEEMVDEIRTFGGAAVETTVSALAYIMKMLSLRPEFQQRIVEEIDEVLEGSDKDLQASDLQRMKFLERFMKESMRLLPPVPLVGRQVKERTVLAGYTLPAGTTLYINVFGTHRDPVHWPDPLRFDPDRFLPENSVGRHPRAFVPFSTGPRNCIGGLYAMLIMKVFLATFLREFRIDPVDDGHNDPPTIPMKVGVASREVGGTRLRFTRRPAYRQGSC